MVTYETVLTAILALPRYRTLNRLKALTLRLFGAKVGKRIVVYPGAWIMPASHLTLGNDVDIARHVTITGKAPISIGNRVLLGYGARIISSNHNIATSERIFDAGHTSAPVVISDDAWIGANAIVLPGVTIGEGAVVAAGAVVTKSVAARTVAGGIPARVIGMRPGTFSNTPSTGQT